MSQFVPLFRKCIRYIPSQKMRILVKVTPEWAAREFIEFEIRMRLVALGAWRTGGEGGKN